MEEKKKCGGKCQQNKSVSEFNKSKATIDGFQYKCKSCDNEACTKQRRAPKGKLVKIYGDMGHTQNRRNKNNSNKHLVLFTKKEFVDKSLIHPTYIQLHKNWAASDYDRTLAPSFDRIDDYGHYSWDNFAGWITWADNKDKGHRDIKNGSNLKISKAVRGVGVKTGDVVEYYSMAETSRKLDIPIASIFNCCNGRMKSTGGYTWSYSDMNGDKQNDRIINDTPNIIPQTTI